jgi:adenylate cyclase
MKSLVRKRLRTIVTFALWGSVIGVTLGLLIGQMDKRPLFFSGVRGAGIGLLIGACVGIGEELILPRWSRKMGFVRFGALRITAYTLVIILALILVNSVDLSLTLDLGLLESASRYFGEDLGRDLLLAMTTSFLQVRKLHNPGEIRRLLTGRYHYPEEEARIFLFADLVGSTGIAERLGHLAYSSFLRDCFSDVSEAILAWRGEVYQHAGDSVIVTWKVGAGVRSAACVQCFFDMVRLLDARQEDYRGRYDVTPRLRAGIHGGDVVTTWVGEARKDLAFHGDTLNTTARLETMCKELGVQCLVSEFVHEAMELPDHLSARSAGTVVPKGRTAAVQLFAVEVVQAVEPS